MMDPSTPGDVEELLVSLPGEDEGIQELIELDNGYSAATYVIFTSGIFLFLVPFISCALVCYTVFKFMAFRTRTNYLLVNFFLTSCLFSVFLALQMCIESITLSYSHLIDFLFLLQLVLFSGTCLMTFLLAFDWYSLAHWHGTFTKFAKYYKWIIGFFYSVIFLVILLTHRIYTLIIIFLYFDMLSYLTILITIIAWNVMRLRRTYTTEVMKTYYAFASATTYVLMWVPLILILILQYVIYHNRYASYWYQVLDIIMVWLIHISACAAIASPGLIAFVLTRWSTQFKMGFGQVLKVNFARNNDLDGDVVYVNYTSNECFEEDVKLS